MDYTNYVEFAAGSATRAPREASSTIFATMKPTAITFSQSVNRALNGTPYVKLLLNEEEKKFILVAADEGLTYLKQGRSQKAIVIWHNKKVVEKIKSLLPEGEKSGFRVYGKAYEEDGDIGIIFDCTKIGSMRKSFKD